MASIDGLFFDPLYRPTPGTDHQAGRPLKAIGRPSLRITQAPGQMLSIDRNHAKDSSVKDVILVQRIF